jgi:hypothetical protein
MKLLAAIPLASVAVLGGCFEDTSDVPQLLVPEDVELHWDASFNGREDGRVALVPVDVMIYEGSSGEPLGDVPLDVHAGSGGVAGIVDPADVVPQAPDLEPAGNAVWDAWRDRWFAFVDGAPPPQAEIRTRTDASGLARFYVMADAFAPVEGDVFAPIPIVVSMGITDDTFLLVPR